jgi:mannose-6-phosphate isomerase
VKIPAEPLFFAPIYKETLWGGTALAERLGRPLSAAKRIGESWELSGYGNDQSTVAAGPLTGNHLARLSAEFPRELLGDIAASGTFPLLCKFIDASQRLSVQVHPDDTQARTNGWGEFGKTECWYIVDAMKGSRCILGFNRNLTIEELRSAVATSTLPDSLSSVAIKPGDMLFIPAGTVHAILEGSLMYEVQETSDTTFRLYDWARLDAAGKPRPLHINEACAVVDRSAFDNRPLPPITLAEKGFRRSIRVACRYFAIEQYAFMQDVEAVMAAKRSFRIVTVISGSACLLYPGGSTELSQGVTVLLPAIMREVRIAGTAGADIIVTWIPDLLQEIVLPLRAKCVRDEAIMNLGGFGARNDLALYLTNRSSGL